jgi:ribosome-associated translation inhibitor RaiA
MQVQPSVIGRRLQVTADVERDILSRLEKLERLAPSIITARVVLELAERHRRAGHRVLVRITLVLPEAEIDVTQNPRAQAVDTSRKADEPASMRKDVKLAIADAFAAARRRLQDHVRRQRGDVKRHTRLKGPTTAERGLELP